MTNHWTDIKNADLVLIMGGNAAEAHPCGFKWVTEAKAHNKARLVVVDPRFTRSASVADLYAPIRTGTDIAFLGGLINYLLENDKIQHEYVRNYTDVSFVVREDYAFEDGMFSGYNAEMRRYDKTSWGYEIGEDGYAVVDPTLSHPRCVFNLLKKHYSRYTPDLVSSICGTPKAQMLQVWETIAECSAPGKVMTIMYALGWTQHSVGSQMIRTGAMLQLLLGNIGMPGGGMNALRGHSNIQGLTDLGLLSNLLPGYLSLALDAEQDYAAYIARRAPKPLRPGQLSYWQNYEKFHVSLMKAWYGKNATAENNWGFDWLPKLDVPGYDVLKVFDMMYEGKVNGYFCQGFNPIASFPDKAKVSAALAKLKYLVIMDPLATETSEFWRNAGEFNDVDTASIQTEVFRLPTTCFAEEDGSLVNSGRWLQWHWKGAEPPGQARTDIAIMAGLFHRLRQAYATEGGAFPDPILNLDWPYLKPDEPGPDEIAREFNGKALEDLYDPATGALQAKAGEQLSGFGLLRVDGSTASGCWIFCGSWTAQGNQMARRDNADPYAMGQTLGWAWSWPANRRILYNRASADPSGKPWDVEKKRLVWWNGKAWGGTDVPDFKADSSPADGMNPFIMNPEGVARLFAVDKMAEGPFPEHYEPFETPIGRNPMHPDNALAISNPAARVFEGDMAMLGKADAFPYAATTYRLTEHFHFWTKHCRLNAITQPEQFVEIGEALAKELGIVAGERVKVSSNRGYIKAVAVVTKRIKPLTVDGKTVHQIGIPLHWGFAGVARNGYLTNTLTPFVGDGNTQTPEFKSFLVNVEKA
ncbi:formate dehydrogenase-N subunit alpha [Ectopseudomonas mendocina]|uniref:Formate dehydrogenase-N subunit alpha n=2 Tax=Ectopseudomonas mendocina TaxID=300 RepID=A0ABD7RW79_ECTME|nr:formate dehydrogenase-N subunit alpha [Pseudomonas mendocina]TRO18283.1 formate dehydrogenase-N subunit alpha [Pseudomonas mendocina]